jgi:hypothetical protein
MTARLGSDETWSVIERGIVKSCVLKNVDQAA